MDFDSISKASFDPYIDTLFHFEADSTKIPLTLVKTTEKTKDILYSFSLIFKGPVEPSLEGGTYTFLHNQLGEGRLFIKPFRRRKDSILYDVSFTKLLDEEDY